MGTQGYVFVFNPYKDEYTKRPEKRVRILDVSDAAHIVNIIPDEVVLEEVSYTYSEARRLIVTDGKNLHLDVNEFGVRR